MTVMTGTGTGTVPEQGGERDWWGQHEQIIAPESVFKSIR